MTAPSPDAQLTELRGLVVTATQRLLGDTIVVADAAWAGPSRLPGWTRAHVASHLARQSDGVGRLVEGIVTGEPQPMYLSPEARTAEIETGAGRTGLELQTDLDTSAGRLTEAFERLDQVGPAGAGPGGGRSSGGRSSGGWSSEVELRGGLVVPARLLPLARLLEVVVHHVDLDIGYELDAVDPVVAEWLIEWVAFRARLRDEFPRVELHADSGLMTTVGSVGEPVVVSGPAPALLGWLTRRTDGFAVSGTAGLTLPSL